MPTTILALPASIRQRIYIDCGLVTWQTLLTSGHGRWEQAHGIRSLLLTCKLLHREITHLFYSQNQFYVPVLEENDLRFLLELSPSTLKHIRHLAIFLDIERSLPRYSEHDCEGPVEYLSEGTCRPPDVIRKISQSWKEALSRLLNHVRDGNLRLSLTCNVDKLSTAQQFMEPLLLHHNTLAECSIRLGYRHSEPLRSLAEKTGRHLLGLDHCRISFALQNLPTEIQLNILRYTDLVTPLKEVNWNPRKGFFIQDSPPCLSYNGLKRDRFFHGGCRFRACGDCWNCDGAGDGAFLENQYETIGCCYTDKDLFDKNSGCFCSRYHAVFNSNSRRCRCWCPPTALFLVDKATRNLAEFIFFSENRIVILPTDTFHDSPHTTSPVRFEASQFLSSRRHSALSSIRFLEIVFPPFQTGYCPAVSRLLGDWYDVIKLIGAKTKLDLLIIRIHMADHLEIDSDQERLPEFRANMTSEDGAGIIGTYRRILKPFSDLKDLKRFYVHLTWPWRWVAQAEDLELFEDEIRQELQDLERELLEEVMGDQSERLEFGKLDCRDSQWLEWARSDFYAG